MGEVFAFTSSAATEGHPGKVCDQVSDAVVDACLKEDESARVSCECCTKTGMIMILGEITTAATVNYEAVIRSTLKDIGYDEPAKGLDHKTVNVIVAIEEQSPDVAQAIDSAKLEERGAGDSSTACGYATDETPEMMPLSHLLATKLASRLAEVRKSKLFDWMRPDGGTQVTLEYMKEASGRLVPRRCQSIVVSTQHAESVSQEQIRDLILEHVVRAVVPPRYLDDDTIYHINPSGRFVCGGPQADAGCTGLQGAADTYGGWVAGNSMSGKDATKTERSAAYAARWVAKSLVAAQLCHRCLVQLSYAIGVAYPLVVHVDSFGTGQSRSGKSDAELLDIVKANFDLRPGPIARDLALHRPIYSKTAVYGHFGKSTKDFPDLAWEMPKQLANS